MSPTTGYNRASDDRTPISLFPMNTTPQLTVPTTAQVTHRDAWRAARLDLLKKEKELTRLQDELGQQRRALPWVKVSQAYRFEGPDGPIDFADVFGPHRQLAIYHFMLGPGWDEGCKSCSYIADHLDGMLPHLAARDVALVAVSRAPWAEIAAFRRRMGWRFPWYSSHGSTFNYDFQVSFTADELASGAVEYNYTRQPFPFEEAPGLSVFARNDSGSIFHTYSTYGRGVELLMGTYRILDLVPQGRNEEDLEYGMEWVRHHDRYEAPAASS